MRKALSITNLSYHFNGNLFSAYDIGLWKPDPGIFLHAAREMGFLPAHCAVVEDSAVGIQAAIAAGMQPILFDPHNIHPAIDGVRIIRHMRELMQTIN